MKRKQSQHKNQVVRISKTSAPLLKKRTLQGKLAHWLIQMGHSTAFELMKIICYLYLMLETIHKLTSQANAPVA